MRRSRLFIGTVLWVFIMLFGLEPATFAASDIRDTGDTSRLKDTLRLENVTIPWSFPLNAATCSLLPAAVGEIKPDDNRSDRIREMTREVLADGSQVIIQDDLIKGRASSDSKNDIYHFIYKNHVVITVSSGLPAIVRVRMIDSFRLKKGDDIIMTVGFDWRWRYPDPNGIDFDLGGDGMNSNFPIKDFIFATADGDNPAPGVTHWQKLSTQGKPQDVLTCDPL